MIFTETRLAGAWTIDPERREDERGFFARVYCEREFREHGLMPHVAQANMSSNPRRGTLRGMHYQVEPYREAKLVRCTRGAIHDVIVDLRPDSPTRLQWIGVDLTAENARMLYVPEGFAHGFVTLEDDTEVTYQVSEFYAPGSERGLRWDDPALGVEWPMEPLVVSDKDRGWALLEETTNLGVTPAGAGVGLRAE
ncbi:MAG TPA: dTDP-4-dehydrorhamnose 3,5-epimerase [Longimicrobiaceae bacterium]|nr:dTDP-4-dehydrorhamnose 3,5-epimerase [Longimicrobiaceae bacterium]